MSWATVSFSFGNPVASEYMVLTLTAPTAALHEDFKCGAVLRSIISSFKV